MYFGFLHAFFCADAGVSSPGEAKARQRNKLAKRTGDKTAPDSVCLTVGRGVVGWGGRPSPLSTAHCLSPESVVSQQQATLPASSRDAPFSLRLTSAFSTQGQTEELAASCTGRNSFQASFQRFISLTLRDLSAARSTSDAKFQVFVGIQLAEVKAKRHAQISVTILRRFECRFKPNAVIKLLSFYESFCRPAHIDV